MNKKHYEVADVFRAGFSTYNAEYGALSKHHYDVANAIMSCHTATLGGHVYRCDSCGHDQIYYNSCRNRHCPSCQGRERARWVEKRVSELLPVPYFHAVFTIPSQLNPFVLRNKAKAYSILFKAASETLLELAKDPKRLGAQSGFLSVLHTWGQNLLDHPHLHCIVPNGGLLGDQWIDGRYKDFLFPIDVVSRLFRGKFMAFFKEAINKGELLMHGELQIYQSDSSQLKEVIDCCYKLNWNVYLEPPFGSPQQVVKYLGRYTHRIAISNSRILNITDSHVTFAWKDYADKGRTKEMCLTHSEFIRRFLLHILPKGFVRIRYYGFLGSRIRKQSLQMCKDHLCGGEEVFRHEADEWEEFKEIVVVAGFKCPHCQKGRMYKHAPLPYTIVADRINTAA